MAWAAPSTKRCSCSTGRSTDCSSEADVEVVDPEVGEFVTSLDMAGCSLTLCWLDDELEPLLGTPAATPGYRTGGGTWTVAPTPTPPSAPAARRPRPISPSAAALAVVAALDAASVAISAAEAELGRLDSVAGDGDHGVGMVRGLAAAAAASRTGATASAALIAAGNAFSDAAGGASGALWGAALLAIGRVLGGASPASGVDPCPDRTAWPPPSSEARDVVMRLGGARVGDKTLVDMLVPFVDAFPPAPGPDRRGCAGARRCRQRDGGSPGDRRDVRHEGSGRDPRRPQHRERGSGRVLAGPRAARHLGALGTRRTSGSHADERRARSPSRSVPMDSAAPSRTCSPTSCGATRGCATSATSGSMPRTTRRLSLGGHRGRGGRRSG